MTHKLKALGLALVAVFAMSAVASSAAQAGIFEITAGTEATITGEQVAGLVTGAETPKHEFTTKAGVVKCTPATFHGVFKTAAPTELKLSATYGNTTAGTGCTLAGVAGPVVHMNGCEYLFTAGDTTPAGNTNAITVATHLVCPAGKVIDITTPVGNPACTITIGPQTFVQSMITAQNNALTGTGMDVTATIDVTGIDYEVHGKCPNAVPETVTQTDGTYRGVVTLKGDAIPGGGAVGVTVT